MRIQHVLKQNLLLLAMAASLCQPIAAQENTDAVKSEVGYNKGYYLSYGDSYQLRVNGRVQTRAHYAYLKSSEHKVDLTLPNARLILAGHVFDPRVGFLTHLGFDQGAPSLVEYFGNFGLIRDDINLKVGRFLGNYSLLESFSTTKLALIDRPRGLFDVWKAGDATGLSLYRSKKNTFGWDVSVFHNGKDRIALPNKTIEEVGNLGAASVSVSYNHNELDTSDEMDLQRGPFRFFVSLGAIGRTQIEKWKFAGYALALETMAKVEGATLAAGFIGGVPVPPRIAGTVEVGPIKRENHQLGAYGQLSYLIDPRFGLAARYDFGGSFDKIIAWQEIIGGPSVYFYDHNLKFQLDGGVGIANEKVSPLVRGQLQLAF